MKQTIIANIVKRIILATHLNILYLMEYIGEPGVDTARYTTSEPYNFKDHEFIVKKMLNDVIRVTFKNVPMYVSDEEILHLCGVYGTVLEDKVYWEQLRVTTTNKKGVLVSPTR